MLGFGLEDVGAIESNFLGTEQNGLRDGSSPGAQETDADIIMR